MDINHPSNYREALQALILADEENERLRQQLAQVEKSQYPDILKASQVAKIMGIAPSTAYELMRRSDFPLLEISGTRVLRDSFFKWLESKERKVQVHPEKDRRTLRQA